MSKATTSELDPEDDAAEGEALPAEAVEQPATFLSYLRETYLTFDRRTLGFARILLGFFLIMDLWRRTSAWMDMYSTEGVLPNDVSLARPQGYMAISILNGFSTPPELAVLWVLILCTYVCLMVGYKTKIAQILS